MYRFGIPCTSRSCYRTCSDPITNFFPDFLATKIGEARARGGSWRTYSDLRQSIFKAASNGATSSPIPREPMKVI